MFGKIFCYLIQGLLLACLAGCASSDVQMMLEYEGAERLEKPDLVLIHDFIPPGKEDETADPTSDSETLEEAETCKEANQVIFNTLAEEMKKLGLPAQRDIDPIPALRDILSIEGEFLCLDEGNRFKRLLIGFGAGAAQVNTIVRIYLQSGDRKELLQEFMATVETSDKAGIGPAMLGFDPMAGGGMISTAVSCGMSAVSESWKSDIEALSHGLAKAIVKSLTPLSIEHGWLEITDALVPPD
jgi:hypothetical protein